MRAVKVSITRLPRPADAGRSRAFPAWIDAEQGIVFSRAVTPRVRDGLVLRLVAKKQSAPARKGPHARGAR